MGNEQCVLPSGWRWVALRELCEADRRIVRPHSRTAAELPYLSLEHIESGTGRVLKEPNGRVDDEGTSTSFIFDTRHVLYGKLRPYLNKVAIPTFRGRCTTELVPLLPVQCDRDFLAWILRRPETVAVAMQEKTGSRMPRADLGELLQMPVPLPPLPEQRRIAALLTEQMAAVERARAGVETQLEAARELPTAYLRNVFDGSEAGGWPRYTLGEVGEIGSGITLGRRLTSECTKAVPYITVANVKDGYLDLRNVKTVQVTTQEQIKYRLKYGDLLLTEGGDPDKLGRGTFWRDQISDCVHQNHIFRVRFDLTRFSPEFLAYQIGSPYGKRYFLAYAKQTTGIATINQRVLANFPLLVPSFETQLGITQTISRLLGDTERLCSSLRTALIQSGNLPTALLARALSGDL